MQSLAWKSYDDFGGSLFEDYEKLSFSKIHRSFLRFLPERGGACLDVGAGSGRDAAAMARRGFRVTAVEPSRILRDLAQRTRADAKIRWIDDSLPNLSKLLASKQRYSFILLSAVWMHIAPNDRSQALKTLTKLLDFEGCIAITLRTGTPCDDRTMYAVSVQELLELSRQVGLKPIYVSRTVQDSLNRNQVQWRKVVLVKSSSDISTS